MKSFLDFVLSRRSTRPLSGVVLADPGRRPEGNGPPDLEEIWQRMTRQLRQLLPGRPSLPGGGSPIKSVGPILAALIVLLLVGWLLTGFFTVQEGSAGVVSQFGAYRHTVGAGTWYHWPQPFQSDEEVSLSQVRSVDVGRNSLMHATSLKDQSMLTSDEQIVDVRFSVQFRIRDAAEFVFNNHHDAGNSDIDDTVTQAGQSAIREIVGRLTMDEAFAEGPGKIETELQQLIQAELDSYKSGVVVTGVTVHQVQAPEQVQAAFDDALKAAQDRERQKSEGQAYANDVIPKAKGDAARVLAEAEGYRSEVVANAQGDADRFKKVLAEYSKAPAVTRERMYLQAMQDILSHTTKVLVDSKNSSNLLYLPLDRLLKDSHADAPVVLPQSTVSVPAPGATPAAPATPAFPNSAADADRARDAARSRDRETR
jgi:membrane protease subunit HflK